jgi:methylthioribose-1-phosphate isomerase
VLCSLGKKIKLQKGFDIVPANLITGIITEKGILGTTKIIELVKRYSKFFNFFPNT